MAENSERRKMGGRINRILRVRLDQQSQLIQYQVVLKERVISRNLLKISISPLGNTSLRSWSSPTTRCCPLLHLLFPKSAELEMWYHKVSPSYKIFLTCKEWFIVFLWADVFSQIVCIRINWVIVVHVVREKLSSRNSAEIILLHSLYLVDLRNAYLLGSNGIECEHARSEII